MTRSTAKWITLKALGWQQSIRFVVLKNRTGSNRSQNAGHLFPCRFDAECFAERAYRDNYSILAVTENGSVDVTPQ